MMPIQTATMLVLPTQPEPGAVSMLKLECRWKQECTKLGPKMHTRWYQLGSHR